MIGASKGTVSFKPPIDTTHSLVPNPSYDAKPAAPLPDWMPAWLADNPYFSAGFGLFGLGFAATVLRTSLQRGVRLAERRMLTTLEIPSKDRSYQWVMHWLVANCSRSRHLGVETTFARDANGHVTTEFGYVPSPGTHWMRHNDNFILVRREREKSMIDLQSGSPWETLTLTTFSWQKHKLGELLRDARDRAVKKEEGRTIIYHSVGQDWRPFGNPKKIRPFDSVILAKSISDEIKSDVQDFLQSDKWYFDRGIPYRRGYLLYGPPGCGKTSYVMALAGELKYNICVLNISDPYLSDDRLNYLLSTVPPRALVLLEDIDGAVTTQEQKDKASSSGAPTTAGGPADNRPSNSANKFPMNPAGIRYSVTFSGLLNALDGVAATEERITMMTTNHVQRLPESLIRPGRIDMRVFIGWATDQQVLRMFLRFFPEEFDKAEEFVTLLSGIRLSMAEL